MNPFKTVTIDGQPHYSGYVRTIVMRFWKGQSKMNDVWESEYNITIANNNSATENATNLEEVYLDKIQ